MGNFQNLGEKNHADRSMHPKTPAKKHNVNYWALRYLVSCQNILSPGDCCHYVIYGVGIETLKCYRVQSIAVINRTYVCIQGGVRVELRDGRRRIQELIRRRDRSLLRPEITVSSILTKNVRPPVTQQKNVNFGPKNPI